MEAVVRFVEILLIQVTPGRNERRSRAEGHRAIGSAARAVTLPGDPRHRFEVEEGCGLEVVVVDVLTADNRES